MNTSPQHYKGVELRLIYRNSYAHQKAKRFRIGNTKQNIWIPNKHLEEDGTLRHNQDIDCILRKSQRQLEIAGYHDPIPGIKRRTTPPEQGVTDKDELLRINQTGRCLVKYIGKTYAYAFGGKTHEAKSRHAYAIRRIDGVRVNASWYIVDSDGDDYTIARGSLNEGLAPNWIVVNTSQSKGMNAHV